MNPPQGPPLPMNVAFQPATGMLQGRYASIQFGTRAAEGFRAKRLIGFFISNETGTSAPLHLSASMTQWSVKYSFFPVTRI
jgi:hypothetical protein